MSRLYDIYRECNGVVTTDSRTIVGGEVFFALRGENFDGNRYAVAALESGAGYVVADDKSLEGVDSRIIVVEDSLVALQNLATEHREHLSAPIFALTGTNGKTTTKEFVKCALMARYERVGATAGNFNNQIGVPLTLLSFSDDIEIGVVEMGASHPGDIAELCAIALPDVGLITNVGKAHLEGFGSELGIRKTKGELYDFLQSNGKVAIYNSDDAVLTEMISERQGLTSVAYSGSGKIDVELKLFGSYNMCNAAAALAVAGYFGADKSMVCRALSEYTPRNNRSEVRSDSPCGNKLVIDCYNANPSSMGLAVAEFISCDSELRKVMILGSMKELGDYSVKEHSALVAKSSAIDTVYFVGDEFDGLVDSERVFHSAEQLIEYIENNPIINSLVLIKGSRSNRLESLLCVL